MKPNRTWLAIAALLIAAGVGAITPYPNVGIALVAGGVILGLRALTKPGP